MEKQLGEELSWGGTGFLAIPVIWTFLYGHRNKQKRVSDEFCLLNVERQKHQKVLGMDTPVGKDRMTLPWLRTISVSTSINATSNHPKHCSSGAIHGLLHHFFFFILVTGFPICVMPSISWAVSGGCWWHRNMGSPSWWHLSVEDVPPSLEQAGHTNSLLYIQQH